MPVTAKTRTLLALLLLSALPFLFFWPLWWPDADARRVFVEGDFTFQHYPMRSFVARELRRGQLPLWDPYTFAGEPAIAESLMATFYPLGLWQAAFPRLPFVALELEAVAHLALAGCFTFLFARRATGRAGAGLIAGLAFSLGGCLTSYPMLQLIILEGAVWLPAALWLLERALPRRSLLGVAAAGVALGMSILAGHTQTALYVAYVAFSYLLFRAWQLRLGWRRTLAAAAIMGAVALGVGAVQWLPTLEMVPLSPRPGLGYDILSGGFQLRELWGLLRPNQPQWSPLYVGLLPLGLALAGAALRRRATTWYWAGMAVAALLLSLGRNGPLYPLASRVLPGLALFRGQERAALVVSLALAVLAGYGYLEVSRRVRWAQIALVPLLALTFVDLYRAGGSVNLQPLPPDGLFPQTAAVQYLQSTGDRLARVSSEGLLPGDGNAGLVYGLRDVCGNGPLYLAAVDDLIQQVPEVRWCRLLNVQHLLTRRAIDHGAFELVQEEAGDRLYRLSLGGRPLWISHDYQIAPSQSAAIALTAAMAEDPMGTVVLERAPDPRPQPATGPEEARVTGFARHWVAAEATLSAPGLLVLSEVSYPGWVVRVNGQAATGLRAYGLLRAIALPAGHWSLEWRFEPLAFRAGAALGALTLLALSASGAWRWSSLRHRSPTLRPALQATTPGSSPAAPHSEEPGPTRRPS